MTFDPSIQVIAGLFVYLGLFVPVSLALIRAWGDLKKRVVRQLKTSSLKSGFGLQKDHGVLAMEVMFPGSLRESREYAKVNSIPFERYNDEVLKYRFYYLIPFIYICVHISSYAAGTLVFLLSDTYPSPLHVIILGALVVFNVAGLLALHLRYDPSA